jgi:hypothetical protein
VSSPNTFRSLRAVILSGVVVAGLGLIGNGAPTPAEDQPVSSAITFTSSPAETREVAPSRSRARRDLERRRTPADSPADDPADNPAEVDPRLIARQMMPSYGFSVGEFGCLDALWVSESDWQVHADNPTSTAYGIPQALLSEWDVPPGYMTNPVTQIRWGLGYIRDSYGSPCVAWEFKQANGFY